MNKLRKNEKGITLIALVVTIVVLLILAGVSISMLTGENRIIEKAGEASKENVHSTVYENLTLEITDYNTEKILGETTTTNYIEYLKNENILDGDLVVNVKELVGNTLSFGNGNLIDGDYYIIEAEPYKIAYYGKSKTMEWQKELVNIEEKHSLGKLSYIVKVGDYVNYAPTYENFGTVKEGIGNGWRVAYVDDTSGIVTLISEGTPLSAQLTNYQNSNCQPISFNYDDIDELFDEKVADNIDILDLEDIKLLCIQAGYVLKHEESVDRSTNERYTVDNDDLNLIHIGEYYMLNTTGTDMYGKDHYFWQLMRNGLQQFVSDDYIGYVGVRLVVDLNSNIECYDGNGTQENPYEIY